MTKKNDLNKKKYIYLIAIFIFILDQMIKLIVTNTMELNEEINVIHNFFSIYFVKNTGAAFSILGNQIMFLIIVTCIFLILIKEYIKREKNITNLAIISFGMIIGGTIGNLFDRIIYKAVIDYLAFDIFTYSFPVFNLADIAITIGTLLLLINLFVESKQEKMIEMKK